MKFKIIDKATNELLHETIQINKAMKLSSKYLAEGRQILILKINNKGFILGKVA